MKITSLKLVNFKNYAEATFHFNNKMVSIVGNNGMGKTNILDAIYYSCIGKSYFQSSDKMVVKTNEEFFRIESNFSNEIENINITVKVKPTALKDVEVNGNKVSKLSEHIGLIPVVIICPDDIIHLLEGNEARRSLINNTIIQYDKEYLTQLNTYTKLLKQRNALLKDFNERKYYDQELLNIITEKMESPALYIHKARKQFVAYIKEPLMNYGKQLSSFKENCTFEYLSQLDDNNFIERSHANLNLDRVTARTNTGIHKDEINFNINDLPIKDYASQGQLKTFIFALKLALYEILQKQTKQKPIFLLDDVFDKLDKNRVRSLLGLLVELDIEQCIITSTDAKLVQNMIGTEIVIEEINLGRNIE